MSTRRIAIVADSHFDEASRFEECCAVHDFIAEDAARRGAELLLHSGDVYERKSTPRERMAAARFFQKASETMPVCIVRGNHDADGDLQLLARLESRNHIAVIERVGLFCEAGIVVGCMGWPSKAWIVAQGAASKAEGEDTAQTALRNVLLGLGNQMDAEAAVLEEQTGVRAPKVLLTHAMVRGSMTSRGQPLVGCDFELGVEDLALARADFYALGHIHMNQEWHASSIGAEPVLYPGSPRRCTYGETERKGYVIADFDGPKCIGWELVPTPCADMFLVDANWVDDLDGARLAFHPYPIPVTPGCDIRIRYTVTADERPVARAAAELERTRLLALGARDVKLDPQVIPTSTARAPEVARAITTTDKIRALWKLRGTTPEPAREARLIEKLSKLEAAS